METNKKKVLVVDDDNNLRKVLIDKLTLSGFDIVEASNGKEGLEKAEQGKKELENALHPENRIKNLEAFWQSVAAQQANAREALFALAITHFQLYEDDQARESAQRAILVEPNDLRRNQVLQEILQEN